MTTLQTAGAAMDSADALKELIAQQAVEIERLDGDIKNRAHAFGLLADENAELRARLAELSAQKPCASMPRCALNGAEDCTCGVNGPCEGLTDVYLAAGASPEPSALQAENAKLITALAACRDAFPVPDAGSRLDGWYCSAMAEPLQVPEYVNACLAVQPSQVMVDMTPPATARDRWMYEQGRLAERDPRTHAIEQPSQAGDDLISACKNLSDYIHAEQCATDGQVAYSTSTINHHVFQIRAAINAKESK